MPDLLTDAEIEEIRGRAEAATAGPWAATGVSMNDGSISITQAAHRIVIACVTNAASFGDFVSAAMRGRRDFGAPDTAKTQWANARLIESCRTDIPRLLATLSHERSLRETELNAERTVIAEKAREYAGHYPEASDGRNTFILLAEWIEARIDAARAAIKETRS